MLPQIAAGINLNLPILQIPSIDEIASGISEINKLKPIKIEDLLGREPAKANEHPH